MITRYRIDRLVTPDDTMAPTPAQERAVLKKLNAMIELQVTETIFGGYPQPFFAVPNSVPAPARNRKNPFGIVNWEDVP